MTALRPALVLAAVAALAACSGTRPGTTGPPLAADGTPVVATWTADTLSLAELDTLYADAGEAVADSAQTPAERRRDFLDRYVDFRLKVLTARAAGYDRDSAYVAEVADYRDQLAGPYFTDRRVLDAIVRDLYDKQAEEVEVSHVLLALGPVAPAADSAAVFARAAALRDSVEAGLISFGDAAVRYSVDPSARQNRGDLGYITGGRTILAFEDAAYDTPVGQIGGPVRTQFGVHLVRVAGRRPYQAEVSARHILVSPDSLVSADSARALVASLRDRVLAGEDFAALAREYSDDPGSGARGGDLGSFGRGRMVAPFEQAAFGLQNVGDVSEPVETQFGWHLVQLTDRPARPTYDEAYDELRRLAERLPRTALKRRELGREFFRENGGTFREDVLREAIASLPADSLVQTVRERGFPADQAERAFATLADSTYRVGQLAPVYRTVRFGPNPAEEMVEVARLWTDDRAVDQAVAGLERRDPEFARVLRAQLRRRRPSLPRGRGQRVDAGPRGRRRAPGLFRRPPRPVPVPRAPPRRRPPRRAGLAPPRRRRARRRRRVAGRGGGPVRRRPPRGHAVRGRLDRVAARRRARPGGRRADGRRGRAARARGLRPRRDRAAPPKDVRRGPRRARGRLPGRGRGGLGGPSASALRRPDLPRAHWR